ncbi:MAG: hypothetical protein LCH79_15295 [Proteobacteria bacterium]|nr:hypothetical protein [Pseudomonadota bacterium]
MKRTISDKGLKAAIEDLLTDKAEAEDRAGVTRTGLTNGEILTALDLDKTRNGEVSAALSKLRNEGKIRTDSGPASSTRGRRYVKRYRWALKGAHTIPATQDMELRRALSMSR